MRRQHVRVRLGTTKSSIPGVAKQRLASRMLLFEPLNVALLIHAFIITGDVTQGLMSINTS